MKNQQRGDRQHCENGIRRSFFRDILKIQAIYVWEVDPQRASNRTLIAKMLRQPLWKEATFPSQWRAESFRISILPRFARPEHDGIVFHAMGNEHPRDFFPRFSEFLGRNGNDVRFLVVREGSGVRFFGIGGD